MNGGPQGRDGLIAQLRTLLVLTNTEAQTATLRHAQARNDGVRWELARHARDAADRARRIEAVLRRLCGVPDVVTPAVTRVGALMSTVAAQVDPLADALFDDLMIVHQLVDRCLYLKASATAAGEQDVVRLAELLLAAHSQTVRWLTSVLVQEAAGGPTVLQPTPLQTVTATAARVVGAPLRWGAVGVDQAIARTRRVSRDAEDSATELDEGAPTMTGDVAETVSVARGAGLATVVCLVPRDRSEQGR